MALTIDNPSSTPIIRQVHSGGNGYLEEEGVFSWSTTDVTGELATGLKTITSVQFTNLGAASADEFCSLSETFVNGTLTRPSTGTITVVRAGASPVSARKVAYKLRGI